MRETLAQIVEAGGNIAIVQLGLSGSFTMNNPFAIDYMRNESANLIVGIDNSVKAGIRTMLEASWNDQVTVQDTARKIKGIIGLDPRRVTALNNYELRLLDEGASNVEGKVLRYGEKLLRDRAMMIGRTESINAGTAGVQAGWKTAQAMNELSPQVEQVWLPSRIAGLCDLCEELPTMPENQHVKVGGLFTSPDGRRISGPTLHPHCLVPDVVVESVTREVGIKAQYRGELIEIHAWGKRLTVGPNHPILTQRGFIPAQFLNEGDYVLCGGIRNGIVDTVGPNENDIPSCIENIFQSLRMSLPVSSVSVPSSSEYLHGDGVGVKSDIEVVCADSLLWRDRVGEHANHNLFVAREMSMRFNGFGMGDLLLHRSLRSASCYMSLRYLLDSLLLRHPRPSNSFGFRLRAWLNAVTKQPFSKGRSTYVTLLRQFLLAFAFDVAPKQIGKVRRIWYSGHIFDLQALGSIYIANGIVASNCRCSVGIKEGTN
jgi:hypothetical protein